ncbi:hypothetical protein [Pseudomonas viridiflava]|uniref:hypothetical protein n=1 Tax=Pseudomonas viridiflava TaxID=33069 RepID=UPI001C31BCF6|nr:hypothetical protein [Pseudomonas viridiflava]QXG50099.1 hypothetical protein KTT57_14205 [Pseudomonas viridiflava]
MIGTLWNLEANVFGKIFGKKKSVVEDQGAQKAAMLDAAIEQASAENPVVHLKIGAEELVQRLLAGMKNERGVHVESLLGILGSLAGFCVVDSVFKQVAASNRSTRECGILDVETADGSRYYLGDPMNHLLAGTDLSLWALVAGMINHLGSQNYPDFAEISGHVDGTLGGPEFGNPRVPEQHKPNDLPINYVRDLWPVVLPIIEQRVPVLQERVTLFGFAVQNVIEMGKDVIQPAMAGRLVMECAVPTAKLDPARIAV